MTTLPPATTLAHARNWATTRFASAGLSAAGRDASLLLSHATGHDIAILIGRDDSVMPQDAMDRFAAMVERRLQREPVSRILGARAFWDIELTVSPDVLDPRPDTETLIDAARHLYKSNPRAPARILDLGCGSGALICALLRVFPDSKGVGVDISGGACEMTRRNAVAAGVADRLEVRCGDWANGLRGSFDLIVSNPPYIRSGDIMGLDPEVRCWDPLVALDGGEDGLDAYRKLASATPTLLAHDGWTILEIGVGQADAVSGLMSAAGYDGSHQFSDLSRTVRALAMQLRP